MNTTINKDIVITHSYSNLSQHNINSNNYVALILAAGLGTRLKPLTNILPKAVLPFMGIIPVIYHAIWKLYITGIKHFVVNLHYLPQIIMQTIDQIPFLEAISLQYSFEKEILGTGGALIPLYKWFDNSNIIIHNADIISDIDIASAVLTHEQNNNIVTMCIIPQIFANKTKIYIKDNKIIGIGEIPANTQYDLVGTFLGIHIVDKKIYDFLPTKPNFLNIINVYQEFLRQHKSIGAYIHKGIWYDIGDFNSYFNSQMHILLELQQQRELILHNLGLSAFASNFQSFLRYDFNPPYLTFMHPTAIVDSNVHLLSNNIISQECVIHSNAHVCNSILLPSTTIAKDQMLIKSIKYQNICINISP